MQGGNALFRDKQTGIYTKPFKRMPQCVQVIGNCYKINLNLTNIKHQFLWASCPSMISFRGKSNWQFTLFKPKQQAFI